MGVRNCSDIGENLHLIMNRLLANEDLIKLLYYNDKDPLSHENLTAEQKREFIFNKLIKIIPRVGPKETANSMIVIRATRGHILKANSEFKTVTITIDVFVPLEQYIIKNENLRPYIILGEIEKSLNNKTVNGLGKMVGGDFDLDFTTDELSCFRQIFHIVSYE